MTAAAMMALPALSTSRVRTFATDPVQLQQLRRRIVVQVQEVAFDDEGCMIDFTSHPTLAFSPDDPEAAVEAMACLWAIRSGIDIASTPEIVPRVTILPRTSAGECVACSGCGGDRSGNAWLPCVACNGTGRMA